MMFGAVVGFHSFKKSLDLKKVCNSRIPDKNHECSFSDRVLLVSRGDLLTGNFEASVTVRLLADLSQFWVPRPRDGKLFHLRFHIRSRYLKMR